MESIKDLLGFSTPYLKAGYRGTKNVKFSISNLISSA